MTYTLPAWLFFIPSVLGLQIGAFVLIADRRATLNRLIFLTSLAVSLWNLENVWELTSLPPAAIPWLRLGGVFLPVLSLHVLVAWRSRGEPALSAFLRVAYAWAALVAATGPRLLEAPLTVTPGFLAFSLYFFAAAALSTRLLAQEFQAARGRERAKVLLIGLATAAAVLSAALGLLYHRGYPFHALNAVSTVVYLGALAWAVVRYRFGNPSLSLRTSAAYSVAQALLIGSYIGAVVLLVTWLPARLSLNPLVVAFFCVLTAGPLFHPLQESLMALLRRFLPLPRDLYYEGLKHFLQEVNVLSPLPDLAGFILTRLATLFELSHAALLVQPPNAPPFLQVVMTGVGWPGLETVALPETPPREWNLAHLRRYSGLPLVAIFPLAGRSRTVGLLAVSRHPDGGLLTSEERDVLQALSRQAGIALENAGLYAELVGLKNHYLTVIQSTVNALLIVDPAGVVRDANAAAEKLFGSAPRLVGQPVEKATGRRSLQSFVSQAVAAKRPATGNELALPGPDGEAVPYAVSVAPLLDPATQACAGAVIVLSDLSLIRAMERQVERAERLAALGQLTAGLAHELRNGLNKITGYATMLVDELPPTDPRRRFPTGILEDAGELEVMLQRFLSFAREERLSCVTFSLADLVEQVLGALQPELRKRRIALVTRLAAQLPPVQGDRAQLAQAFTNVVLNAMEAMTRGGTLTVALEPAPGGVTLRVGDTGPGIPAEQRELVFNPFFTTKPEGTGLGLSITDRIVTRHGGTVELDSRPGRGTTVSLLLPLDGCRKEG